MSDRVPSSPYSKEAVLKREDEEAARCHASSNRVPEQVVALYQYAVKHGMLEAAAWISARTKYAIPNSAAKKKGRVIMAGPPKLVLIERVEKSPHYHFNKAQVLALLAGDEKWDDRPEYVE